MLLLVFTTFAKTAETEQWYKTAKMQGGAGARKDIEYRQILLVS